ncbi:MAG: DEAD/DEAH box helicase family protein [Ardenticatenales bacterium]|nr:DEAD/DEAH box helicase family protein [Ardenticatenales bacterium]
MPPPATPEQRARETIDVSLARSGWAVQDRASMNLYASAGVAVREFPLAPGHGYADYLLFVDGKAVGVLEAKPEGHTLTGVEPQSQRYAGGLPASLTAPVRPLPFLYQSSGSVTRFTNLLDPDPRSREVFAVHQPTTLAEWLAADPLSDWTRGWSDTKRIAEAFPRLEGAWAERPATLRSRVRMMPPVNERGLWPNQIEGLTNLEASLAQNRPRSLVQMITGSGKTFFAVSAAYRLIKFGGARRVLFLVDRSNLGLQADNEFGGYRTPDDQRKFTELYNVQHLAGNTIGSSSKVVITTIQRLYSMLKGEAEFDPALEDESFFERGLVPTEPLPVVYNAQIPPEYFDVVFIDECHRSIYSLWRQVLEYFDAFLVGLTATPAKHTFGFFNRNLVMEYDHEQAVADGVNVDFEVYRIRTQISEQGSTIEAGTGATMGLRDRRTRSVRWELPDEDVTYEAKDLDRNVVSRDQIRLIVRTFKDRLFKEIFPGRTEVPKTLIFAKDDSHAEDIVDVVREEFGRGNDFCVKITYKSTGTAPGQLIRDFRNSYNPRVAVTVDMIATGTDIKPVEIVMFMRATKSRVLFEQMKGRGVRVMAEDDLRAVTPDARAKTHFMIVDCVGVTEMDIADTQPLERKRNIAFKALLDHVAMGGADPDMLSSLASRLARLEREFGPEEDRRVAEVADGARLGDITAAIVEALDPDYRLDRARGRYGLAAGDEPTDALWKAVTSDVLREAVRPLAANPALRTLLVDIKRQFEQIIDEVSLDVLLAAGHSAEATEKARTLVESWEAFIEANKAEIDALQFFYSQPHARRLRFRDVKALAEAIHLPPRQWTPERLWQAYELLDRNRVRGASAQRLLTDLVSLVRFGIHQDDELVPFHDLVQQRFDHWLAQQAQLGRQFTGEQAQWLAMMRDHIAASVEIDVEDFGYTPFVEQGGLGRAREVFGGELGVVIRELNEVLAA